MRKLDADPTDKESITLQEEATVMGNTFSLLFENLPETSRVSTTAQQLLNQRILLNNPSQCAEFETRKSSTNKHFWQTTRRSIFLPEIATTKNSTPYSPLIHPEDVKKTPTILTFTINHHYRRSGAQQDLLLAQSETGWIPYSYTKGSAIKNNTKPTILTSWKQVEPLTIYQPNDEWADGTLISYWDRMSSDPFYKLTAEFASRNLSLVKLFEDIDSFNRSLQ